MNRKTKAGRAVLEFVALALIVWAFARLGWQLGGGA